MSGKSGLGLTIARAGRLAFAAGSGPGAWRGIALYGAILSLNFLGVWISLKQITWSRDFFDALEQVNTPEVLRQVGVFVSLTAASAGAWLIADYLNKGLTIRLRERLTSQALALWLGNRAYWMLRPGYGITPIENPDQRIAEDCALFVRRFLEFTLELISQAVAIVSYVAILWSLSDFVLRLGGFGLAIEVPHYMFWLAPVYVGLASVITHLLGRPLKGLYFARERVEGDFRHALVRLRDTADQVAMTGGEEAEHRRLATRFEAIRGNWTAIMRRELIMGLFNRPYYGTVLRVPTFLALPAYLAGAVTLGGMMQLASAFSQVTTTLSWFIFNYRDLSEFVAVCERLDGLMAAARDPRPLPTAPRLLRRETSADGSLRLEGVRLATPDGRWLDRIAGYQVRRGARLWLAGASGRGKTTLLSAIAGYWHWGEGRITLPKGRMVLLPAGAPVLADTILAAACHPEDPARHDPARLRAVLTRLGLGHRLDPEMIETSLTGLSMGERQRLGLARAVLLRPDWLLMDEATSALDPVAEGDLLGWLAAELPDTTFIMVAHRLPAGIALDDTLHLGPQEPERKTA